MDTINLMYHDSYLQNKKESGFQEASANTYKIKRTAFLRQIQLIDNYIKEKKLSKDAVRFTFDDGGSSFYTLFAPILEEYGYKGYFFIATKYIGSQGFMTEDQIRELDRRGHIIGGHSDTHRQRMNTLSYNELLEDWARCSVKLQSILGYKVLSCSLPCGYMSKNMMRVLKDLGYNNVYTSEPIEKPKVKNGLNLYGRYGIRESMSDDYVLSIISSPYVRMKIKVRKTVLNLAKIILGNSYITIRELLFNKKRI